MNYELTDIWPTLLLPYVQISEDPVPLIVVGGGGVLLKNVKQLKGVSEVIFPKNFQVSQT
jgi:hypothetical protein